EEQNNKLFDAEREKGLSEYLEEQDRWEQLRDRGVQEYKKQQKMESPREGSPEYQQYVDKKEYDDAIYERSRRIHVKVRNQVVGNTSQNISKLESEELGLYSDRPRYDLRKRSTNKWVAGNGAFKGSSSSSGNNIIPPAQDFPVNNDFPPAPPPFEPADESQFTPAPTYDSNNGGVPYDPSQAAPEVNIPPPPPPPPDFDF
ncbi:MAG: hypothetical protein ACXWQQ_12575, partial [Pseudobdellovibrio sp.]